MKNSHHAHGTMINGELLYEVRTPDCGEKLLFQLVADRSGPIILLKPKGLKGYYYLPVSDLLLCCGFAS